jgi:hypothetical protein
MTLKTPFVKGNQYYKMADPNNVGRPPRYITTIRQELEQHPERIQLCINKIIWYVQNDNGKLGLVAAVDYLDRMGARVPKQTDINVTGMIAVGTPEDYRRAAQLMALDKSKELELLNQPQIASHNGNCAPQSALIDKSTPTIVSVDSTATSQDEQQQALHDLSVLSTIDNSIELASEDVQ